MKKITILLLIVPLLITIVSKGMEFKSSLMNCDENFEKKVEKLKSQIIFNPSIESKSSDVSFLTVKKTLNRVTNIYIKKNIKLKIITQGPFGKLKAAKGDYPECYPARFSLKLYYTF